jgi:hypothetical protein
MQSKDRFSSYGRGDCALACAPVEDIVFRDCILTLWVQQTYTALS